MLLTHISLFYGINMERWMQIYLYVFIYVCIYINIYICINIQTPTNFPLSQEPTGDVTFEWHE